jgi:hypothetical protein
MHMHVNRLSRMSKILVAPAILAILLFNALPSQAAIPAPGGGSSFHARIGKILGMVPTLNRIGAIGIGSAGNLVNHGGPVMHTNTVYAIYWVPSGYTVSANYESLINRYFGDVAADNGKTTNVYYSDTQYSDHSGNVTYSSTFGGSYVDTTALPLSGCVNPPVTVCLSDAQLQSEIAKDVQAAGWTPSPSKEFFLFTAKGIGSCTDVTSTACSFTTYCAYHSWFGSGSTVTLYANMPYADTSSNTCDSGQHPNNDEADATLNVTSHEHNETITDEQGSAWYDASGNENGDKCAWNFGTALGSTQSGQYNQVINGHDYYLQQEWSNKSSGCVLTGQ